MRISIKSFEIILQSYFVYLVANLYSLITLDIIPMWLVFISIIIYIIINISVSFYNRRIQTKRLRICVDGCDLLCIFLVSVTATIIFSIYGITGHFNYSNLSTSPKLWIINSLIAILVEALVFWNGMIRIYTTSMQLGIKWRVIGAICGWIPVVHIIVLTIMIKKVYQEVWFENDKIILNDKRAADAICATKYPILLVHGVFFRDFRYLNYWGRIPKELETNGDVIDLNRENIKGFDVREFYVSLVNKLKIRGL